MFTKENKEIELTIDNIKISSTKKINPLVDFSTINKPLVKNINLKIKKLNTIQQYILPLISQGVDLICKAPTGSGKTLCYIIPVIQKILKNPNSKAVIICPVRELCDQIKSVCLELTKKLFVNKKNENCDLYYNPKTANQPISVMTIRSDKQELVDYSDANIIIATPGRLIFNLEKKFINFDNLDTIVFDEADKLYDSTFKRQIDTIKSFIKKDVQTCMFSATYCKEIRDIFNLITKPDRVYFEADFEIKTNVKQEIYPNFKKIDKIVEVLKSLTLVGNWRETVESEKVMIFVERKVDCLKVANLLNSKGYNSVTLHGDKSQYERNEAISKFKSGLSSILIATNVAARGLDIREVKLVINYDLPRTIDEYIHRIGRTGRAGEEGRAISFFDWKYNSNIVDGLIKIFSDNKKEIPKVLLQRNADASKKEFTSVNKAFKPRKNENIYKYKKTVKNMQYINTSSKSQEQPIESQLEDLKITNTCESSDEELGAW